jgi:predicted nucleotide-binding protein (sugar kinase/HSP70/actin superfamily)
VGIPYALHLVDEMDLWIDFFKRLNVTVITSSGCDDPVTIGKRIAQAEFCAHLLHTMDM